ncbi:MAG TPA: Nif3-like dinuclear metal center hexameric protein [Candidatus Methanofastidiosa archaeon]|nr:Nif3-like dinuclear metal center hexameric protein [Candidatus Methanofastidiosa archaeon]
MKRNEVVGVIEEYAPLDLAESWDNCGVLLEGKEHVSSVSVMLDPTIDTLEAAKGDIILSHHPLIFSPLKRLERDMLQKAKLLLSREQTFYAAHTTLDYAPYGVSWSLAQRIGLMEDDDSSPQIRTGSFTYGSVEELLDVLRSSLGNKVLKVVGKKDEIGKTAILPGSGFGEEMIERCYDLGIDTMISGDLKHHPAMKGLDLGMTLIDAGHRETELPGIERVAEYLDRRLDGVDVELICPVEPWSYEIDSSPL